MELLELIRSRRSIRKWKDQDVPDKSIRVLIDAARWAPSSCNRQTCCFLVIRQDERRKVIGNALVRGMSFVCKAPVHILALVDVRSYHLPGERHLPFLDAAVAIENMLLMAHYLGLGACWIDWSMSPRNQKRVLHMLNIPPWMMPIALIALGHPDIMPKSPVRRKLEDVIVYESFETGRPFTG
jgi:nitroreductase